MPDEAPGATGTPVDDAASASTPSPRRRVLVLPRQSQIFFFAVLVLMLFLTWTVFRPFLIYMVTGVFVAVLALPIDRLWERIFPNKVAAVFTILTLIVLITAPLAGLGFALYQDTKDIAQDVQEGKLEDWADRALSLADPFLPTQTAEQRNETIQQIVDETEQRANDLLASLGNRLLSGLANFFIAFTVILFVTYYMLTDGERLIGYLRRATPLPPRQVDYLMGEAHRGLRAVFVGQMLTSIIQAVVGGIGFLIAGVPGAILWTAVMAILALLPVVGAFLVWIPAGIYLLVSGEIGWGIFLLLWGALVVSNVDNFVRPKLIGDRSGIHPLFVLVGVLGGVAAFGFIGLFLGPVLVGVTVSVLKVWEEEYLDPRVNQRPPETPAGP